MSHTNTTGVQVHRTSPAKLGTTGLHDINASSYAFGARKKGIGKPTITPAADQGSTARPSAFARNLGKMATQLPRSHHAPAAPWRNQTTPRGYTCPELAPYVGRPGAMDAFNKPSRVGAQLFYRDGRVEAVA